RVGLVALEGDIGLVGSVHACLPDGTDDQQTARRSIARLIEDHRAMAEVVCDAAVVVAEVAQEDGSTVVRSRVDPVAYLLQALAPVDVAVADGEVRLVARIVD